MDSNVGSHIKYEAAKFSLGLGLGLGLGAGGAAEPVVEAPALARFNNMTTAFADKAVEALVSDAKRKDRDAPAAADATPSASGQSKSKKAKKKAAQQQQQEAAAATTGAIDDDTKPITAAAEAADPYPDLAQAATEYIPLGELKAEPGRGSEACGATAAAAKPAVTAPGAKVGVDDEDRALREAGQKPYWMSYCCNISSPLLRLHQEIVSLVELLHPTPAEVADRQAAVDQVADAVTSIWPHATVQVFGSFATGLYVPTSDVDLVVLNTKVDVQSGLKALARLLQTRNVATKMQVIAKAKVPIIKFETVDHGGLNFDISFDVPNGPQAAELVKEVISDWPMLRPLVLVLKLFLQQRELNEVYTGGIGSYALITMLIAFLQLHNSRRRGAGGAGRGKGGVAATASALEPSLGVLLIDFFRLYGRVINTRQVGISATGGGHYFSKEERDGGSWVTEGREFMLAVEDPKDASNDICRSSFNIMRVRSAFDFAYQQLAAPAAPHESLLQRILRLGPILASRTRPADPSSLYPKVNHEEEQARRQGREDRKKGGKGGDRQRAQAEAAEGEVEERGRGRAEKKRQRSRSADGQGGVRGGAEGERGKQRRREDGDGEHHRERERERDASEERGGAKRRREESREDRGSGRSRDAGASGRGRAREGEEDWDGDRHGGRGGDGRERDSEQAGGRGQDKRHEAGRHEGKGRGGGGHKRGRDDYEEHYQGQFDDRAGSYDDHGGEEGGHRHGRHHHEGHHDRHNHHNHHSHHNHHNHQHGRQRSRSPGGRNQAESQRWRGGTSNSIVASAPAPRREQAREERGGRAPYGAAAAHRTQEVQQESSNPYAVPGGAAHGQGQWQQAPRQAAFVVGYGGDGRNRGQGGRGGSGGGGGGGGRPTHRRHY